MPAFHGGLADNPLCNARSTVLQGGVSPDYGWWEATDTVIRAGAAAWRVPLLPISVSPVWEAGDGAPAAATSPTWSQPGSDDGGRCTLQVGVYRPPVTNKRPTVIGALVITAAVLAACGGDDDGVGGGDGLSAGSGDGEAAAP